MILYHGTSADFKAIKLSRCRTGTYFGKGFYLTTSLEQAERRAQLKSELTGSAPRVIAYQFDESLLSESRLKVLRFEMLSAQWVQFVYRNREDPAFRHDYDLVIGPVADDDLRLQFKRVRERQIDISELTEQIGDRTSDIQYCFCTKAEIKYLKRL